jgi:hypothetical protein
MVLLATSYSPDAHIKELAHRWGDTVEITVFTDEYFGSANLFSTLDDIIPRKAAKSSASRARYMRISNI